MKDVLSLLRQEEFRFNMKGWRGDAGKFFAATDENAVVLAERQRWGTDARDLYLGAEEASLEPLREMAAVAGSWIGSEIDESGEDAMTLCQRLSARLEPDFVVLKEGEDGVYVAVAGAVCFPSYWSFKEALGKKLFEIHSIVPGLNASIGKNIQALLRRLGPGEAWERLNWGISLSAERNQHPTRDLPRLAEATEVGQAWVRSESQILFKLPRSGAILFGIRLVNVGFDELRKCPGAAAAVARQIETMPEAMREYKGLARNLHLLDPWLG